jgi:flagellar assembly protein FliH
VASILKQNVLLRGADTPQPVAFNIEDVQARARDYLLEVQQQAAEFLQRAGEEAKTIKEQARQAGLAAAQVEFERRVAKSAKELSDQRCHTAIAAGENTLQQLASATNQWLEAWRDQTVQLAVKMAEKLVRHELSFQSAAVLERWLEEALRAARDTRELRICVHPNDMEVAGAALERLAKAVPNAAAATVIADAEVKPGGCLMLSEQGSIDLQLETQLERLAGSLGSM